ncbi:hypothetical protein EUX98_g3796 [Antrodiella citrinella]|uniref:Uncharacterized protein n=1 Tax=Antrodiella citrinella TaxID=2447956 RepID=A0A4V3XIT0_9APHY|nr:hypothetical protein EUX98_g3796 [Antrodiella citrinella]
MQADESAGTVIRKYAATHRTLQRAIDHPTKLSPSDITDALRNLSNHLNTRESIQDLKDGVKDLHDRAVAIEKSLSLTEDVLTILQRGKIATSLKVELESILAMFLMRHEDYIDVFWDTHPLSVKADKVVQDFIDHMIPLLGDSRVSKASKLAEVDTLKKFLTVDGADAELLRQRAVKLVSGLKAVLQKWEQAVERHGLDVTSDHITQFDTELESLDSTIGDLADKIMKIGVALKITSAFPAVCKDLGEFTPEWTDAWFLDVIFHAISSQVQEKVRVEQHEIYTSLDTQEAARDSAVLELEDHRQTNASLVGVTRSVSNIAWQIKATTKIWTTLSTDVQALADALDKDTTAVFNARLETTTQLYKSLLSALKEYDRLFTSLVRPVVRSS